MQHDEQDMIASSSIGEIQAGNTRAGRAVYSPPVLHRLSTDKAEATKGTTGPEAGITTSLS